MCATATAKRRRRQAKNGYKHLALHGNPPRPIYKHHSAAYYQNKLSSLIMKERQMALNKARSKKK